MTENLWLVVGLGNPGPSYAGNRHNIGYLVNDELASRVGSGFRPHKTGRADVVEGRLGGPGGARVVLARPRCYMNETGGPVSALAKFYKIPVERIIAIHDELDIGFDTLRVKRGGGDNGHNGLRSIRRSMDSGEFYRVRVGIGRPPEGVDPAEFVLAVLNFTPVPRDGYRIGVPAAGTYVELINSDAAAYGGSNVGNGGVVFSEPIASHGHADSLRLMLPPLGCLLLKPAR